MINATTLLKLRARRRIASLDALDPMRAQQKVLLSLLRRAASTRFGRDHGFSSIDTVAAYQARVPMRRYEDFRRDYWQADFPVLENVTWPGRIPFFALSSGTTSDVQKYIPVTHETVRANARAMLDLMSFHVARHPGSRLLAGRNFMLGGSTDLKELAPGVRAGDLSGIAAASVPWWTKGRFFPPPDLAFITDWDRKVAALAEASRHQDITCFGGTPSWMLVLFERVASLQPDAPKRLAHFWPRLDLLIHGGVNFAPYRPSFERWLDGSQAELSELYAASEGFVAYQDRGSGEGLRLVLDNGLFYEFIRSDALGEANPPREWIGSVETGINYAILVTSCAGLFSYLVGDTIRFVDRDPPRLLVTGRTALSLSAFGEHLIGEEIESAVAEAAAAIGNPVTEFSVGPVFSGPVFSGPVFSGPVFSDPVFSGPVFATPGHHLFVVEFADADPDAMTAERFLATLDHRLATLNQDYRDHRQGDVGMGRPQLATAPKGSFAAWMKSRGRLGGQNKVPRVLADPQALEQLRQFVARHAKI
jgi:hypothetical protein